eukprot:388564_1
MQRPTLKSNLDDTGHKLERIGSWDHGLEPHDIGDDEGGHKIESVQEFLKSAVRLSWRALNNCFDPDLKKAWDTHTEEIVAGEKMAVKSVIHKESFDAPC